MWVCGVVPWVGFRLGLWMVCGCGRVVARGWIWVFGVWWVVWGVPGFRILLMPDGIFFNSGSVAVVAVQVKSIDMCLYVPFSSQTNLAYDIVAVLFSHF